MTTQICIQATETDPSTSDLRTFAEHGEGLRAQLEAKVELATELSLAPVHREQARDHLEEFATGQLAGYLAATDRTLYAAAAGAAETKLLVRGLRAQHLQLAAEIEQLERTDDPEAFAASAHILIGLLRACLHLEREVLLPALNDLPGLDLTSLLTDRDILLANAQLESSEIVDVRAAPDGDRHPRAFPATFPDQHRWNYLDTGPEQWRVQIGRSSDKDRDDD